MSDRGSPPAREERTLLLARTLWDYLRLGQPPEPAGAILVFGSSDVRPAERGARLFLEGIAPLVVISGGRGRYTGPWPRPEAEVFAGEAMRLGVPRDRIVLEDRATNTGENVIFTRRLLEGMGLDPARWLLVHVPYMERRSLATFRKFWPGKAAATASPEIPFEDYPAGAITRDFLVRRMMGEIRRMLEYPGRGFQVDQDVPPEVGAAWEELTALGIDGD